ncbi:MAG: c-type cytochrome, partial [Acetobacteraceae bacterium]
MKRTDAFLALIAMGYLLTAVVPPGSNAAPPSATAVATPGAPPPAQAVTDGQLVYRNCQACHSLEPGRTLIGPSLAGLFGRHSGTAPNFDYSPAMRKANIVWDETTLNEYLTAPQKLVPGNRMPFPG